MSLSKFKRADMLRVMLNIGCLFDIQTGRYYIGERGESICNGGLPNFEGVAGLPNMFKTEISLFKMATAMARYYQAFLQAHDTENTMQISRIARAIAVHRALQHLDLYDPNCERFSFSDAKVYPGGNEWFDDVKAVSKERRDNKELLLTTPFWNPKTQSNVKTLIPFLQFTDSFSGMSSDAVQAVYEKNSVGESGMNMVAMKGSNVKSQMVDQLPGVTSSGGMYMIMTAHVGQEYQLDMYKPNIRKLKFLKGDLKLKKVPENFSFLTGNCWYCAAVTVMLDKDKQVEFPRDSEDDMKGDTDLIAVTLINLRGKFGPSGVPFDIVISQSEGVKVGLTEFKYIRDNDRFGIGGNLQNYHLDILPEVNLTRKSIRAKIEENPLLQRALTITSEMCQMRLMWHHLEERHCISPKKLYESLKDKGYDWNLLLNTRGYWMFKEDEDQCPLPFLSTMDLLRMHTGEYHPYWYPKSREEMNLSPVSLEAAA